MCCFSLLLQRAEQTEEKENFVRRGLKNMKKNWHTLFLICYITLFFIIPTTTTFRTSHTKTHKNTHTHTVVVVV